MLYFKCQWSCYVCVYGAELVEDLLISMVGCRSQGSGKTEMHVTLQAVHKLGRETLQKVSLFATDSWPWRLNCVEPSWLLQVLGKLSPNSCALGPNCPPFGRTVGSRGPICPKPIRLPQVQGKLGPGQIGLGYWALYRDLCVAVAPLSTIVSEKPLYFHAVGGFLPPWRALERVEQSRACGTHQPLSDNCQYSDTHQIHMDRSNTNHKYFSDNS